MKKKIIKINLLLIVIVTGLVIFNACKKDEVYPRTRLFQPVLNEDLKAVDNTVVVNLGKMKEAINYTIEVSRDSFKTTDYSFDIDTNYFIINKNLIGEDLLWYTIYQVRVTAHADDPNYNSKASVLGSIRTQKFPSNMGTPTQFDILDNRARVFWTPSGAAITTVKVFAGTDLRLVSPLAVFELMEAEKTNALKIVNGLLPNTTYQIAIFSGATLRGWEKYTTRVALVSGDNVVNLTGIDTVVNLAAMIPTMANGSIVLLEGGKTYLAGGYAFDRSITFLSGYSFTPALPIINCATNFNLAEGGNVALIKFKDVQLTAPGGFGGNYVFNIDKNGTIGEINYESCVIRTLRGILRMKGGAGTLSKFTILNCTLDSIKDYGILSVDVNTWKCDDILLKNSTISKAQAFLVSRNNSNSVVVDGCTISEAPAQAGVVFRWREAGKDNVTNGITISNTIWGRGWFMATTGTPVYAVDGYDGLGSSNFIIQNSFTTNDFSYAAGKEQIPGFPTATYPGTIYNLWINPDLMNFNFKDTGFSGKGSSGDPRWRINL